MFVFHAKSKDLKKNRYFDQNCIDLSPMIIDSWKAAWCCRCQVSGIVSHVCLCLKTARLAAQANTTSVCCSELLGHICIRLSYIRMCAIFFSVHADVALSTRLTPIPILLFCSFLRNTQLEQDISSQTQFTNAFLLVTQSVPWNSPEITSSGRRYGTGTGSSATHWYSIHSKLKNNMNKWRINKCYIFLLLFEQILWENLLWHCRLFDGNRVEST